MTKRRINIVSLVKIREDVANFLLEHHDSSNDEAHLRFMLDQVLQRFLGDHYEQFLDQYTAETGGQWNSGSESSEPKKLPNGLKQIPQEPDDAQPSKPEE